MNQLGRRIAYFGPVAPVRGLIGEVHLRPQMRWPGKMDERHGAIAVVLPPEHLDEAGPFAEENGIPRNGYPLGLIMRGLKANRFDICERLGSRLVDPVGSPEPRPYAQDHPFPCPDGPSDLCVEQPGWLILERLDNRPRRAQ